MSQSADEVRQRVAELFNAGDVVALQQYVAGLEKEQTDGAEVIAAFLGQADCVRYVANGIEFQAGGRPVSTPAEREVLLLPVSVSLCGTDIDLIGKAQKGQLPPESVGKVVGHEAAGIVVGKGSGVSEWQIGQMVCLDSHFACDDPTHKNFNDCVMSGRSCDGIVGGIRGSMKTDGTRNEPIDGYWSRVISVPVSALPIELPVAVAKHLAAPSTLESLGNIYMIIGQLGQVGLLADPARSLFVVSGLGATGYPMAAVAKHYGFQVWGINPSSGKRTFAEEAGACHKTFGTTTELLPEIQKLLKDGEVDNVIFATMAGDESALVDAITVLNDSSLAGAKRRACVVFGLFGDATKPMPFWSGEKALTQREFVFSRQHFTTTEGTEVYGVCGRDLVAWKTLMKDLQPTADGQAPELTVMLNKAIHRIEATDPLRAIAETLNEGPQAVKSLLDEHHAMKLAANLLYVKTK